MGVMNHSNETCNIFDTLPAQTFENCMLGKLFMWLEDVLTRNVSDRGFYYNLRAKYRMNHAYNISESGLTPESN